MSLQSKLLLPATVASILMFMTGCGRKGPLIYPDMLAPDAPANVQAEQTAGYLRLAFDLPSRDLAGHKLKENQLAGVKVMRFVESSSKESCKPCLKEMLLYRKIDLDFPGDEVKRAGNRLILLDQDVQKGKRYSYRLVPYQKDGVEGKASPVTVASIEVPPTPPTLKATTSMGAVYLQIELPDFFEGDGEIKGVRLFRKSKADNLNETPLSMVSALSGRYEDRGVQVGKVYIYSGRTIFRRPDGVMAESAPSTEVEVTVSDSP